MPCVTDAETLMQTHRKLAIKTVHRFWPMLRSVPGNRYEDWTQVALIALWLAAQRYDPDRGLQFSTFAVAYMRGYLLREVDRQRPQGYRIHGGDLERPWTFSILSLDGIDVAGPDVDSEERTGPATLADVLELPVLDDRQRTALRLRAQGVTLRQIAVELDMHPTYMSRYLLQTIAFIRRELTGERMPVVQPRIRFAETARP